MDRSLRQEKKEWTDDMGEISGFSRGYEAACRAMVIAGIEWVDSNPQEDPVFSSYKGIYGVINPENDAAKSLHQAMLAPPVFFNGKKIQDKVGDDCTGAMIQATTTHVLAYKQLGWEEYCRRLKKENS